MQLRISTTSIESFRLFQNSDWFTEQKIIEQLTGEFVATPQMEFGTAYHDLIETGGQNIDGGYLSQNVRISSELAAPALQFRSEHPLLIPEIKKTKVIQLQNHEVTLVGKIDGIEGLLAHEHKTTPNPDYDKYADSYQWRMYCYIFGVPVVQYNIFNLTGSKLDEATSAQDFANRLSSITLDSFKLPAYPNLENDIIIKLKEFVDFLEYRNLLEYFPMKVDKNV